MNRKLIGVGLAGFVGLLCLLGFMFWLTPSLDKSAEAPVRMQWIAQHGDFFNGFAGPLLTFLTFIGVLVTINLQLREQAAASKRDVEQAALQHRQTFERAFFEMLGVLNGIIDQLRYGGDMYKGRECFVRYTDTLLKTTDTIDFTLRGQERTLAGYKKFWAGHRQSLGHYFRVLYNTLRFIDTAEDIDTQRYIRLLRAQLSDYEMVMIFFNCVTPLGAKLRPYVEKYNLLDNMMEDLIAPALRDMWNDPVPEKW